MQKISRDQFEKLAYELLMQDLRPFAASLGVDARIFSQYERGHDRANQATVCMLEEISTDEQDIGLLHRALKYCGYYSIARKLILVKDNEQD